MLVLPLVLLAACGDEPVGPRGSTADGPRLSTAAARGLPGLVSNRVKYRDEGQRPTTGRSGSASLTARAMLDRDNRVQFDVTTGSAEDLDRGTGPGNLEKIQLKVFDAADNHISTNNYSRLRNGGFASYVFANLQRGSRIQVQANVRGIDPNRNDVVTVSDAVKLRPDLAVTALAAPTRSVPNVPVTIGATVVELNGDLGARADCVLRVDGVEVDRAAGIWVDAGGSVSCAFSHAFTATGARAVSVSAVRVTPGDYDPGNNEITGSITIAHPAADEFTIEANASDLRYSYFSMSRFSTSWSGDGGATFYSSLVEVNENVEGRNQWASQRATTAREIAFPMTVRIRHVSGGLEITDETIPELEAGSFDAGSGYRRDCAEQVIISESAGDLWLQVCSGFNTEGGEVRPFSQVDQNRWAGEVTYFGHRFLGQWYEGECTTECYVENWDEVRRAGMPLPTLGSDYTLQVVLTRDGVDAEAAISVPLLPVNWSQRFPETGESCTSWAFGAEWDFYRGTACSANGSSEQGVRGSAFRQPAP